MRRSSLLAGVVAAAAFLTSCKPQFLRTSERLGAQSELVFRGTIRQVGTSTIDAEDASGLAVVSVDEVLSAVGSLPSLQGNLVTVRLADPSIARPGQQRTFFTRAWHFGDGVGLVELGSTVALSPKEADEARAAIERAKTQRTDAVLLRRLQDAELVLVGRVVAVRSADVPRTASEHDPEWQEAEVRVERLLKGSHGGATVAVLFPGSRDVMWRNAPRFQPEMEGVLLLRRPPAVRGAKAGALAAVDREDFRPRSELPRIERLLSRR